MRHGGPARLPQDDRPAARGRLPGSGGETRPARIALRHHEAGIVAPQPDDRHRLATTQLFGKIAVTIENRLRIAAVEIFDQPRAAERHRVAQAARSSLSSDQISERERTRWSISASVWSGSGVMRSLSVPRGTVG